MERIPAIVTAGDGKASRAVYGDAKVYPDVAGRTLVARTVGVVMRVPEISENWVVGNAERLERSERRTGRLSAILPRSSGKGAFCNIRRQRGSGRPRR